MLKSDDYFAPYYTYFDCLISLFVFMLMVFRLRHTILAGKWLLYLNFTHFFVALDFHFHGIYFKVVTWYQQEERALLIASRVHSHIFFVSQLSNRISFKVQFVFSVLLAVI